MSSPPKRSPASPSWPAERAFTGQEAGASHAPALDAAGRVFPVPALVSHLSVGQNICLPWRIHHVPLDSNYVGLLVDTFDLRAVLDLHPEQLSAVQQLHVSYVRALAGRPSEVVIPTDLSAQSAEAMRDLQVVATELGQPYRWQDPPCPGALSDDYLPPSLDDIASAPPLSGIQTALISKAEQILSGLPGPVPLAEDPFLGAPGENSRS